MLNCSKRRILTHQQTDNHPSLMSLSNAPTLKRRAHSPSSDEHQIPRNRARTATPQTTPSLAHLKDNEDTHIPAAPADRIENISPRESSIDKMSPDNPRSLSDEEVGPFSSKLTPPVTIASPSPLPHPRKATPDRRALEVPDTISLRIHLCYSVPLHQSRIRKSWPQPVIWKFRWEEDNLNSLVAKVRYRIKRAALKEFMWPLDQALYVRPTHHAAQQCYLPLTVGDYEVKLRRAWKAEARRLPGVDEIVVDVFAYLTDASYRPLAIGSEGQGPIKRSSCKSGNQVFVDHIQTAINDNPMAKHSAKMPPPSAIVPPVKPRTATVHPSQPLNNEKKPLHQHIAEENETRQSEDCSFTLNIQIKKIRVATGPWAPRHGLGWASELHGW